MFVSSALFWGLLVRFLDGDKVVPELCIQVRMLFLKPGIDQAEVESVLRLGRRLPNGGFGNLRWFSWDYSIGDNHNLTLDYRYDFRRDKWLLHEAKLTRGPKTVMRVSSPTAVKRNDGKGIDPKLLEEVIRAVQHQKAPSSK
jgi:hypothetical protein